MALALLDYQHVGGHARGQGVAGGSPPALIERIYADTPPVVVRHVRRRG